MQLIGLGHLSRVGKDSAATYLQHHLQARGKRVRCVSFAWKLKETCYDLFAYAGVKPPIYYENNPVARNEKLSIGITVVELWIKVGNLMREVDPNVWITNATQAENFDYVIVRDVRYPNEVEFIRVLGGLVYRVDRPGYMGLDSVADNSLRGYDGWDGYIVNDGDLKKLSASCESLVSGWTKIG